MGNRSRQFNVAHALPADLGAGDLHAAFLADMPLVFYPFIFSAVLLDKLSEAFTFIKKHYKVINLVSGILLIIVGLAMAFGLLNSLLAITM